MPEPADPPLPPGGDPLGDVRWQPWSPAEVASRLQNVDVPWAFAAGWALDLFRGRETRAHDDVEIAVPAAAFDLIREALTPYEFDIVGAGRRWPVSDGQALVHTHQTWLRNPETGAYHMDVFREPHDGGVWICRRNPALRLPYTELVRWTPDGLPYMAPEVVLLFKAKWDRPKDRTDFAAVAPLLDEKSMRWLTDALSRVHPGHKWIEEVARLTAKQTQ